VGVSPLTISADANGYTYRFKQQAEATSQQNQEIQKEIASNKLQLTSLQATLGTKEVENTQASGEIERLTARLTSMEKQHAAAITSLM